MPPASWGAFESLPGAANHNFEMLCRGLIRRHYGRFGAFRALANQPGVEFHLKLHSSCSLGEPGHWFGWQCRWYDLPRGRGLGNTRRRQILDAIRQTEKAIPDLTDWVLWTRWPLSASDQAWLDKCQTRFRLHPWSSAEVEEHLSGAAEILRATYFGELVFTPSVLADLHEKAVEPIKRRWQPQVHQTVDAERHLRRVLCEPLAWSELLNVMNLLEQDAKGIERDLSQLAPDLSVASAEVAKACHQSAAELKGAHTLLVSGDFDLLRDQLVNGLAQACDTVAALPHKLRARRARAALSITNALADLRRGSRLAQQLNDCLSKRLVAVLADAGCGKTQLAAQLTMSVADRPAGILLFGRNLSARNSLDTLARTVIVQGQPVSTIDALVAAVDAAAQRAHIRLPIFIDGLNEAEDARDWQAPLASLEKAMRQYSQVVLVCTVRPAFADQALPYEVEKLEVAGFDRDSDAAIRRYFQHYRINPQYAEFPWNYLEHPLTLRLFCEVTNPTRSNVVGVEAIPRSLTALFERYLLQAAERIVYLAPRTHRYFEGDVCRAILKIGAALWDQKARSLNEDEVRRFLGDDQRAWNESIITALEQEGILLRQPGNDGRGNHVAIVYDALAGHVIAEELLVRRGITQLEEWLKEPTTLNALTEAAQDQHPLGADTLRGLAGLLPRRFFRLQLWSLLSGPLRTDALRMAAELEASYLDAATVSELATLVAGESMRCRDPLNRLFSTRGVPIHPLNAEFLDRVLRPMTVCQRDFRWTEWLRRACNDVYGQIPIQSDLDRLVERWKILQPRGPADCLRARWVMWLLTSTVRPLRDKATCALYWFGRGEPTALFDLTLDSLAINDPYVPERMLAASYGVTMAYQQRSAEFEAALAPFLRGLRDALTGPNASAPTNHWLSRLYVAGTVALARSFHIAAAPEGLDVDGDLSFASARPVESISQQDARASQVKRALHDDFERYTLGHLIDYQRQGESPLLEHSAAVAHVLGTMWALGWHEKPFRQIDDDISEGRYRPRSKVVETDRYGKKYGWIGYFNYAGILADSGLLRDRRLSDVDIDPSFPNPPPIASIKMPKWNRPKPSDDRRWLRQGIVSVPAELLYRREIDSLIGPWILVSGFMETNKDLSGRRVHGYLAALLVSHSNVSGLVETMLDIDLGAWWLLLEEPSDAYTFAGEIPWSREFDRLESGEFSNRRTIKVRGKQVQFETMAHRFGWESYHSTLNKAGQVSVPSSSFSRLFDLCGVPQSFDQKDRDGKWASLSRQAPEGFDGRLLYLREDLVHAYAASRKLIWVACGERQMVPLEGSIREWLFDQPPGMNTWRLVRGGETLSKAFSANRAKHHRMKAKRKK